MYTFNLKQACLFDFMFMLYSSCHFNVQFCEAVSGFMFVTMLTKPTCILKALVHVWVLKLHLPAFICTESVCFIYR